MSDRKTPAQDMGVLKADLALIGPQRSSLSDGSGAPSISGPGDQTALSGALQPWRMMRG
jgi:hypothetical protein